MYNWRKKYAGMDSSHIKEMKALQEENRRLKHTHVPGMAVVKIPRMPVPVIDDPATAQCI
jgi:hypothetical protein